MFSLLITKVPSKFRIAGYDVTVGMSLIGFALFEAASVFVAFGLESLLKLFVQLCGDDDSEE